MESNYALIIGQGRSGTNWLNEMFDLSSQTFCRNEPHGFKSSPLAELVDHRFVSQLDVSLLEEKWDNAVVSVSSKMGCRDHPIVMPKKFIYPISFNFGLYRILRGPKYRKLLSIISPSLRGDEWEMPSWIGDMRLQNNSLKVLKLVQCPGWAEFVLKKRRDVPVFHIIRHPGGFINSWSNRYLIKKPAQEVLLANRKRLNNIVEIDPSWAVRFGNYEEMGVIETELLYWHYANEIVYNAGGNNNNYHIISYEDLTDNPQKIMQDYYSVCGLDYDCEIEKALNILCKQSKQIARTWKDNLDLNVIKLVEKVLLNSPFRSMWE